MLVAAFETAAADLGPLAHALADRPGVCWLDGARGHGAAGRFSFLGCDPSATRVVRQRDPDPLSVVDELSSAPRDIIDLADGLTSARVPRWVGYIAYDACWARTDVTRPRHPRADDPLLWFARYDAWLVLDHATHRTFLVGDDLEACERLRDKLTRPPRSLHAVVGSLKTSDLDAHARAITAALDQIARGNVYQVNLARSFDAELRGDALALWTAMRAQGDVPFGMYLDAGDHQVLARTMESFLHWDRATRVLQTRPIKGTIARSGSADAREAERLRNDEKERAEHTMIVDLMRNDLGRVAEVGSVQPIEVMRVEPYAGLSHLVSTVRCTTRADVGLAQILDATFPPGSVTGTPKLAAIALIEALEPEPRGIYTGAVGHIDHAGGCHFAVAIRTAVVRDGTVRYFAGGGIVEGSDVAREIGETELKARVLRDAIDTLGRQRAREPKRL